MKESNAHAANAMSSAHPGKVDASQKGQHGIDAEGPARRLVRRNEVEELLPALIRVRTRERERETGRQGERKRESWEIVKGKGASERRGARGER